MQYSKVSILLVFIYLALHFDKGKSLCARSYSILKERNTAVPPWALGLGLLPVFDCSAGAITFRVILCQSL